jgi:hypothetical protein
MTIIIISSAFSALILFCIAERWCEHREQKAFNTGYACGYSDGKEDAK